MTEGVAEVEGVALAEFARALLATGDVLPGRGPLRRTRSKGSPRIAWLAEAVKRASLDWLIRSGGWRNRAVVTGGRRREGRVWASGIAEALDLGLGAASIDLIAHAYVAQDAARARPEGRGIPALPSEVAPRATLDFILFHLVVDALLDARGDPPPARPLQAARGAKVDPKAKEREVELAKRLEVLAARRAAIVARSPLTALFRADELAFAGTANALESPEGEYRSQLAEAATRAAQLFAPLVKGDRAALLVYLDDAIARRWLDAEKARRQLPIELAHARYASFATTLEGLVAAAAAAKRPDALAPVARFLERLLVVAGTRDRASQDLAAYAHAASLAATTTTTGPASLRQRLQATIARVFAAGELLGAVADRALDTPFVERTEEEKLFLGQYHESFKLGRPELAAIRRVLEGEVG